MRAAIDVLGADKVMFAADYPMERQDEEVAKFAALDLTPDERKRIGEDNARRVFGL